MKLKKGITKLFGIPGSGKSTYQSEHIKEGLTYGGIEGNLITSFSRGAVAELVRRNLKGVKLNKEERSHFGTLHSICYHMLNAPKMVEGSSYIQEFNDQFPEYALSTGKVDEDTMNTSSHTQGDMLMLKYMDYRSILKPYSEWETSVKQFAEAWDTFKNGRMDFLDLIDETFKRDLYPSEKIQFMFVDEAQDLVPVEFRLIKKWYQKIPNGIISGDDDQCHPPNTKVFIHSNGRKSFSASVDYLEAKKIELLDSNRDTLLAYNHKYKTYNFSNFKNKKYYYNDDIIRLETIYYSVDYTLGHKVFVKWSEHYLRSSNKANVGAFLAMNRFGKFVTFTNKLFDINNSFLPIEKAKEYGFIHLWLLKISNKEEPLKQELLEVGEDTDEISKKFNIYLAFPMWSRDNQYDYSGESELFVIPAYLISKFEKSTFDLIQGKETSKRFNSSFKNKFKGDFIYRRIKNVKTYKYEGYVYSLDVDKYHNYFHTPTTVFENHPARALKGYMPNKELDLPILTHNCIYDFKGADPNLLLDFKTDRIEILDESHRVPHSILDYSMKWIKKVNRRQPKQYKGNSTIGIINYSNLNYKNAQQVVKSLMNEINNNKTVMVLASCSYMLDPIKNKMKQEGIPFHNPYRTARYDWNPLRVEKKKMPLGRRLYDYLSLHDDDKDLNWDINTANLADPFEDLFEDEDTIIQTPSENPFADIEEARDTDSLFDDETLMQGKYWFGSQFKNWALYTSKVFKRGGKKTVDKIKEDVKVTEKMLKYIFKNSEDIDKMLQTDIDWFKTALKKNSFNEYPFKVYERFGKNSLIEDPKIILGTIYSMKGAEADVVYVFPDLSAKGFKAYQKNPDPVTRLYYVAFTRAKERVELMAPKSYKSVRWLRK